MIHTIQYDAILSSLIKSNKFHLWFINVGKSLRFELPAHYENLMHWLILGWLCIWLFMRHLFMFSIITHYNNRCSSHIKCYTWRIHFCSYCHWTGTVVDLSANEYNCLMFWFRPIGTTTFTQLQWYTTTRKYVQKATSHCVRTCYMFMVLLIK